MTDTPQASAIAASILLDLLGAEGFADEAVTYVAENLNSPLTDEQRLLVKVGAVKAAQIVMDEVRKFATREVITS